MEDRRLALRGSAPRRLTDLPEELLTQVLGKVSESGRFTYALACRQWYTLAPEVQRKAELRHEQLPSVVLRELSIFRNLKWVIQTGSSSHGLTVNDLMLLNAIPGLERIHFDEHVDVATPNRGHNPWLSSDSTSTELPEEEAVKLELFKKFIVSFPALVSLSIPNLRGYYELPDSIDTLTKLEELRFHPWPEGSPEAADFFWRYHNPGDILHLPQSLGRCQSLKKLSLGSRVIDSVEPLCSLSSLELLQIDCPPLMRLPREIGALRSLKELYVRASVSDLPEEILLLTSLKCLAVQSSQLETVPEGLGQLSNLKRLILEAPKLRKMPESLWSLSRLEHLQAGAHRWAWASLFEAAARPGAVLKINDRDDEGRAEALAQRQAEWQAREAELDPNHGKGPYRGPWHRLRTLGIEGVQQLHMPDIAHRLRNLRALRVKSFYTLRHMMPLAPMTRLEELTLSDLPHLWGFPSGILELKTLKKLSIMRLGGPRSESFNVHLKDWSGLSSLESLSIRAFDGLADLPPSLSTLQALEVVQLSEMPRLVLPPELFSIPRLRILELEALKGVKMLPQGVDWAAVDHLESLRLAQMDFLQELPAELWRLPQLRDLSICSCPRFRGLPERLPASLQSLTVGSLKLLHSLPECIGELQQLQHLTVAHCTSFVLLPHSIRRLTGLKRLTLTFLPSLDQGVDSLCQLSGLEDLDMYSIRGGEAIAAGILAKKDALLPHLTSACKERLANGHPGLWG